MSEKRYKRTTTYILNLIFSNNQITIVRIDREVVLIWCFFLVKRTKDM
jgi:hypothetical protein